MASRVRESSWVYIVDDVAMTALAVASVAMLVYESTHALTSAQVGMLDGIDTGIALVFLGEFLIRFALAPRKAAYFKHNWWLLLASIPVSTPWTQGLRALRLLTIMRLGRVLTGTEAILDYCERFFTQTRAVYVIVLFFLIVAAGGAAFQLFETGTNPAVHGYLDSLWWAIGTVTTSGSGAIYPITEGGKIVSIVLMVSGIGLSGVFTALVASFLLREARRR
jgi:voltage-gated potassium channel